MALCGLAVSQIKTIHVYDFDNTREDPTVSRHCARSQTILTQSSSVPEPSSQPTTMEWLDNRLPSGIRKLRQWRMVARPQHPLCYWQGYRDRGTQSLEWLVERANCVTLRTSVLT